MSRLAKHRYELVRNEALNRCYITRVSSGSPHCFTCEDEVDAQMLVRVLNSHDEIAGALLMMVRDFGSIENASDVQRHTVDVAKESLAKAGFCKKEGAA